MKGSAYKTRRGAYFLALSLLSIFGSDRVLGAPQPILPEMMFREDYGLEIPSQTLVDRLKQRVERKEENIEKEIAELAEEQMEIQALLDAKAISQKEQHHRQQQQQQQQQQLQLQQQQQQQQQHQQQDLSMDDFETLPVPAAVYHTGPLHSGKRTSYMALCHFKICNMGRKRQM